MKLLLFGLWLLSMSMAGSLQNGTAAVSATKTESRPAFDAAADELLKKLSDFYKGVRSSDVEMNVQMLQEIPGASKREQKMKATLSIARPNRVSLRITESPDGPTTLVSDGKTVWTFADTL